MGGKMCAVVRVDFTHLSDGGHKSREASTVGSLWRVVDWRRVKGIVICCRRCFGGRGGDVDCARVGSHGGQESEVGMKMKAGGVSGRVTCGRDGCGDLVGVTARVAARRFM